MPVFGINNIQHTKKLADALDLPTWLVKVIITSQKKYSANVFFLAWSGFQWQI